MLKRTCIIIIKVVVQLSANQENLKNHKRDTIIDQLKTEGYFTLYM
jgi:hypothetical protein